ncbi:MAG TPA: Yip1 family protein [Gaiellaceae bacterium]|nr:Yip1 family protein [Gaiellaceae bacterium]
MRDWWIRTVLVLQAPRAVFAALRDDSPEAVSDRSEPVLLIIWLAGIAGVLATSTAGHLLDDNDYDGLLIAVWTFIAGGMYGAATYWVFGGILQVVLTRLGSLGTYRRTRHLLAFASVPIVLSLVLWPVKLSLYGAALFHRGGADSGTGGEVFALLQLAFLAWAAGLLVIGIRVVHGWTWERAIGALAIAVVVPVVLGVALTSV